MPSPIPPDVLDGLKKMAAIVDWYRSRRCDHGFASGPGHKCYNAPDYEIGIALRWINLHANLDEREM